MLEIIIDYLGHFLILKLLDQIFMYFKFPSTTDGSK